MQRAMEKRTKYEPGIGPGEGNLRVLPRPSPCRPHQLPHLRSRARLRQGPGGHLRRRPVLACHPRPGAGGLDEAGKTLASHRTCVWRARTQRRPAAVAERIPAAMWHRRAARPPPRPDQRRALPCEDLAGPRKSRAPQSCLGSAPRAGREGRQERGAGAGAWQAFAACDARIRGPASPAAAAAVLTAGTPLQCYATSCCNHVCEHAAQAAKRLGIDAWWSKHAGACILAHN